MTAPGAMAALKPDAGGSERLQGTAGAAFYALPAAGVKSSGITPRTHAIDATDNIDHLTRRALVRI